ncbi:transposase, partial [uncultured Bacteroides sp.]
SKFKVIPKRWIVERAFAWLENFRRLTIDYEFHLTRFARNESQDCHCRK